MTDDPDPFPWLPLTDVLTWLQKESDDSRAGLIDQCRMAACEWVVDQRSDLAPAVDAAEGTTFPTKRRHQLKAAGLLVTARLVDRADGKVSYAELGSLATAEGSDPEVRRYLGIKIVVG